ncbi:MAG: phosphoenolpyruvate synthase [Deltaproteobacteria bacterium]|nr:phosphoenolpyruvate synthase [Deltaproteobacteria bacterium]
MVSALKRAWQLITGISRDLEDQSHLAEKHTHFQRLLHANNQVLALMADMEEKLSGDYLFDFQYIISAVNQLRQETATLVEALNQMSGDRYQDLAQVLDQIMAELEEVLEQRWVIPEAPLVIWFEDLNVGMIEVVGGKNANLAEIRNRLGLPVPPGFAISSYAYKFFLDYNQLGERITETLKQWRLDDLDSLARVSDELKEMINAAQVPTELETAMFEAYERLAKRVGSRPLLALRSSAVGEDLTFTFAGQYASYLNVPATDMAARYKDIIASLFTPRALFYYKNKGFREEEMAMGVMVLPMVQSKASGVLFTRQTELADLEVVLINAVWGLGKYAVSGRVYPDHYLAAYQPPGKIVRKIIPAKQEMLISLPEGGVAEVPVPAEQVNTPCLNEYQITKLVEWALLLEDHFGKPQDVEWALDQEDKLWLLQCRPLKVPTHKGVEPRPRIVKDYPLLLEQGTVVCRGVGSGPVVMVRQDQDLKNFPVGGVLVARHTSPKYVTVMPNAAAIITDTGSPTGHMALLAREFQIPTIINTGRATQVLIPDQVVTVDAYYNNVYDGMVPELLEAPRGKNNDLAETQVFQTLKTVIKKVVPLNLVNPQEETFAPSHCRTLHDIVRFAHEVSMREMFKLTEGEFQDRRGVVELESELPFKVAILDLGGGLKRGFRSKVRPAQILSIPFKAFWEGLAAMRWPQAKPTGVKSFASVFVNTDAEVAQGAAPYRDQSYLIISKNYMNFSIHLGYHLSTVEAYVSDQINDNYLTFHFQGGGSTAARRERRVRLIETIIDHLHLNYQRKGDHLEARLAKYPPAEMACRLKILGKLTLYTKQLDMVMFSDGIVDWYIKDFLQEHVKIEEKH